MRIEFKSLTGPQVALLLGGAVIVGAAYKVFGQNTAGFVAVIMSILNAMGGPKGGTPASGEAPSAAPPAPKDPPANLCAPLGVIALLAALAGAACGAVSPPDPNKALADGFHIGTCQQEGRLAKAHDAGPDAAWAAYDGCMRDYGFRDGGAK